MKKKILIITTGGTLASAKGKDGLVPELNSNDIFSNMEGVMSCYDVSFLELMSIDSSNMQPEEWQRIARAVYERVHAYAGMVIIHGTDTMAYTAAALSFMLKNVPIPVVLTGSQLSILNPIADAVENCRCAVNMAEVVCILNGVIWRRLSVQ
ncbi:MAG: asparaginase domain-containing protein [Acetivibrio ethanolgignens]